MRLLRSNDTIALERIINVPPRKIGAATVATLRQASDACGVSLWGAVEMYSAEREALEGMIQNFGQVPEG